MVGPNQMLLDQIEIDLRNANDQILTVYIDVFDNSLSRKWLTALDHLLARGYHLEKNYCFFGFVEHERDGWKLLDLVNQSIAAINRADLGYHIDDHFTMENCLGIGVVTNRRDLSDLVIGRSIIHEKFNHLHRYFEDLQGVSGGLSPYYLRADAETRWHIRQLNLLCHEFESWALSYRKDLEAPEWKRPSQLMCWLNAPRFVLEEEDYELFGVDTLSRGCGDVYVGVNKAVGKHHWEVFNDEGRDSRIDELTTSTLRSQTEASGDFDIEWAVDPSPYAFQRKLLDNFRGWLRDNGFDPEDKRLTIGHPKIGCVDLARSFGTTDTQGIWNKLIGYLDVYAVRTSTQQAIYDYRWSDPDFIDRQINILKEKN